MEPLPGLLCNLADAPTAVSECFHILQWNFNFFVLIRFHCYDKMSNISNLGGQILTLYSVYSPLLSHFWDWHGNRSMWGRLLISRKTGTKEKLGDESGIRCHLDGMAPSELLHPAVYPFLKFSPFSKQCQQLGTNWSTCEWIWGISYSSQSNYLL